mmetsp:Transcript_41089/g.108770  ORF Transcript_41089/g.108770 Transcript_41089/m.108770 type:complete len:213 (-) Transcript_41089:444-1082(-)
MTSFSLSGCNLFPRGSGSSRLLGAGLWPRFALVTGAITVSLGGVTSSVAGATRKVVVSSWPSTWAMEVRPFFPLPCCVFLFCSCRPRFPPFPGGSHGPSSLSSISSAAAARERASCRSSTSAVRPLFPFPSAFLVFSSTVRFPRFATLRGSFSETSFTSVFQSISSVITSLPPLGKHRGVVSGTFLFDGTDPFDSNLSASCSRCTRPFGAAR